MWWTVTKIPLEKIIGCSPNEAGFLQTMAFFLGRTLVLLMRCPFRTFFFFCLSTSVSYLVNYIFVRAVELMAVVPGSSGHSSVEI